MAVDEIKIRLTAFWVLILTVAYIFLGTVAIPVVLVIDFALRSFNLGKWSPLFRLSEWTANRLHWVGKPVYLPAKRFAARVGFTFSVLILLFTVFGSPAGFVLAVVLAVFAALESLAGICAGCYVYDWINRLSR